MDFFYLTQHADETPNVNLKMYFFFIKISRQEILIMNVLQIYVYIVHFKAKPSFHINFHISQTNIYS